MSLPYYKYVLGLCLSLLPVWLFAASNSAAVPVMVSPQWVKQQLATNAILVIDARQPHKYKQGHIPGAINIDVDRTFIPTGNHSRVADIHHIGKLFSEHGLAHDDHIVLYDEGNLIDAARFFWVLEVFGHQRVSVMDGGMRLWSMDYQTETTPNHRKPGQYVPTIQHRRITSKTAMQLAILNPDVSIIDSRSHEEFIGKKSIARRSGHIPNAVNIPWDDNYFQSDSVNRFLSDNQLAAQYLPYKDKRVITYCNKGKQSALTYFILRHLDYDVSVYDGAWFEWGNDESLPITYPSP